MRLLLSVLLFITILLSALCTYAQNTAKVEQDIQHKAQTTLGTFQSLLNLLTDETTGDGNKLRLISNSYDPSSVHQIFWDEKVIIEDDYSDTSFVDYTNAVDRTIETYLNNLDAFYTASTLPSIEFSNIIPGKIKLSDNVFLRVYFESQFKNPHKRSQTLYRKTQRVATFRAQKVGASWRTFIVGISFFQPSDAAEFFPGNAPVVVTPKTEPAPAKQDPAPVPPVVKTEPAAAKYTIDTKPAYKRGRTYNFDWKGGQSSDQVQLELYKGSEKQAQVFSGNNKGNTQFAIPAKSKPGKDYTIRINENGNNAGQSESFRIKRKMPFILKPLAIVAVGVVVGVIICPGCPPEPTPLPDPNLP